MTLADKADPKGINSFFSLILGLLYPRTFPLLTYICRLKCPDREA
jgi:hypothetical protein